MYVGLGCTRISLAAARVPYILCTAPKLNTRRSSKDTSSPPSAEQVSPRDIALEFRRLAHGDATASPRPSTSASSTSTIPSGHLAISTLSKAKQKEVKRRGFQAVIRWCETHSALHSTTPIGNNDAFSEQLEMDAAALAWVQAILPFLSCGQCLVLIGFLSDVTLRLADAEAAVSPREAAECTTGHPKEQKGKHPSAKRLTGLLNDALTHLGVLVHQVTGNEQLERQPLPAIMSAVYGLHRLTDPSCRLSSDDVVKATLSPPKALMFAMLYNMRLNFSAPLASPSAQNHQDDRKQLSQLREGTPVNDSVDSKRGSNTQSMDVENHEELTTQVLMTFLAVMTPTRREELLAGADNIVFRNVVAHLSDRVKPLLRSRRDLIAEAARLGGEDNNDGTTEEVDANNDVVSHEAASLPGHRETREAPTSITKQLTALGAEETKQQQRQGNELVYFTLSECLAIMRNIRGMQGMHRLRILQYLLCVLHDATAMAWSDADLLTLVHIFDCLEDTPMGPRLPLTNYLVASVPVPRDMAIVARFLPRVCDAEAYLRRLELTPERARGLATSQAAALLEAGLGRHNWDMTKALILAAGGVQEGGPVATLLQKQQHGEAGGSMTDKLPLTVPAVVILTSLLPPIQRREESEPSLQDDKIAAATLCSDNDEDDVSSEKAAWLSSLVCCLDWDTGVVAADKPPISSSDATSATPTLQYHTPDMAAATHSADDVEAMKHALPALEAYLYCVESHNGGGPMLTHRLSDRTLLNRYVRFIFHVDNNLPTYHIMRVLCHLERHLSSVKAQRQLLERMMRFNGSDTMAAMFRFLHLLAARVAVLGISDPSLNKLLMKQNSLDPGKLLSHREGDPHQKTAVGLSPDRLRSPWHYFTCLRNGMSYVLATKAFWETPSASDETRQILARWVSHFFRHAAPRAAEPGTAGRSFHEVEVPAPSAEGKEAGPEDSAAGGDCSGDDTSLSLEQSRRNAVTGAHADEILVLALRAGARLPTSVVVDLAHRFREELSTPSSAVETGEADEEDSLLRPSHLYVHLPSKAMDKNLGNVPVAKLPSAAPFVALVRGNCGFVLPLSGAYLERLVATSDSGILLPVVTAFLNSVKSNRQSPELLDDLDIVFRVLTVFFARVEGGGDAFRLTGPLLVSQGEKERQEPSANGTSSAVVEDAPGELLNGVVRVLLAHVLQGRRSSRELAKVVAKEREAVVHSETDNPLLTGVEEGTMGEEEEETAPGDDARLEEEHEEPPAVLADEERDASVRAAQHQAEGQLLRALSLFSREQIKDVALAPYEHLDECFPKVHAYLFLRVRQQADELSVKDLLQFASRYPQSTDLVVSRLAKLDMKLMVDITDFLRIARKLPMAVNEIIIGAHVDSLTLAWCTRLLSTLAPRQDEVGTALVARILHRLDDLLEGEDVSESDRNLLLMVLQSYLDPPSTLGDAQDHGQGLSDNKETDQANPTRMAAGEADAQDWKSRRELVLRMCDRLLNVDAIKDIPSLQAFLTAYPASLQSVTDAAVTRRAESQVLHALLREIPCPVSDIRRFAVTMLRHRLLSRTACRAIRKAVFDNEEAWLALLSACEEGTLTWDPEAAAPVTREQLVSSLVELALVLSLADAGASDTLDAVCAHFSSPTEQLLILTLITDAAANYKRGQQQQHHHRHNSANPSSSAATSIEVQHAGCIRDLCTRLLEAGPQLSPSGFSRFLQNVSRLRMWDVVRATLRANPNVKADFESSLSSSLRRADAHSRCVMAKALATDADMFAAHEALVMGLLRSDVDVLASEDLELVLVASLQLRSMEEVEQTLDAIGTKLMGGLAQCKRSTLVRLLQCHAQFNVRDDDLLTKTLMALEQQCCRPGSSEMKLDVNQVVTVLQAAVTLELSLPERFLLLCFGRLERAADQMSFALLAQACRLAVELEMGYSTSIHVLVSRLLESRDGLRQGKAYRGVVELVCDEYDVQAPQQLRQLRLRHRRERERLEDFWRTRQHVHRTALQY